MNCPRCNLPLTKKNTSSTELDNKETNYKTHVPIELDVCHSCNGIWFDKGELIKLDKISEPTLIEIRKVPNEKAQLKALTCPSCGHFPMGKADHPRDSKAVLDYCSQCKGIWLDGGELEAIQKESWFATMGRVFRWLLAIDG